MSGIDTPLAVFDVCDTLFYSNTTHDFIAFAVAADRGVVSRLIHASFNRKASPLYYVVLLISRVLDTDIHLKMNLLFLRGYPKKELERTAARFMSEVLRNRHIDEVHALLNDHIKAGRTVVLCSASIEPVVRAVANALGIEHFFGSPLRYDHGIFNGALERSIRGNKAVELRAHGLNGKINFAVSDNTSDIELLREALDPLAVVHNGKHREFWESHAIRTLELER